MPALSSPDRALVRGEGHRSQFYLKAIVPATVFAARVNSATLVKGDVAIAFDTVTTGAYTAIVSGMTLLVGSAAGLSDIGYGRLRVKSATSSVLNLATNVIPWADNLYLTVLKEFLEWPKEVRIESGVVYVDGNDAYTNLTQDTKWGPVVIMGASGAFLFDGVSTSVTFDLSPSYALATGATISTYAINYGDGSTSTTAATTHSYTAEGTYIVTATVTDSLGNSATSRRVIVITTAVNAFTDFEPGTLECQIDGGAKQTFVVRGACTLADFPRGCQIVMFADEWFGTTQGSIGYEAYRSSVKFFGTIDEGSISLNPQTSEITFSASSLDGMMGRNAPFPVFIQDAATASAWEQAETLTMRRALYFLLKFHSTVLEVADVFLQADETELAFADFAGDSVWSQLVGFARTRRFMRCGVTPRGSLYVRTDPNLLPTGSRSAVAVNCQLTDADWINQVAIAERDWPATAFLQLSGVSYDGNPAHEVSPLFGKAPGYPNHTGGMLPYGTPEDAPYYQFVDQTEANLWAGLRLAQLNPDTGDIVIPLDGNWANVFDPAWQEYVKAPTAGFQTVRGAQLANARLIVRRMSVQFSAANGTTETTITCEQETSGAAGESGDSPPTPPPAPTTPPVPVTPPPPPPTDCPLCNTWRSKVYIATSSKGVFYTSDFASGGVLNVGQPTWTAVNTGLASLVIRQMVGDPHDPATYQWALAANVLYLRTSGGSWVSKATGASLAALCPTSFTPNIVSIAVNINQPAGYLSVTLSNGAGLGTSVYLLETSDYGATWTYVALIYYLGSFANGFNQRHTYGAFVGGSAYGAGDVVIVPAYSAGSQGWSALRISHDGGATWATHDDPLVTANSDHDYELWNVRPDPSDQGIVFANGGDVVTGQSGVIRSTDGGDHFTLFNSGQNNPYWYALSVVYNSAGPATTWRMFGSSVNARRLYKTVDTGATITSNNCTDLPLAGSGAPGTTTMTYGLSIVQDSTDFLYIVANHGIASASDHLIYASADDGATAAGKAGTDRSSGSTTGIPYDAGVVVDILQIWNEA